jgi:predicted transposase/invertase (TIGR01784 family)
MGNLIHNPHDKVSKKYLGDIEVAKRFFTQHLPVDMQALVKLQSLQLEKGTFVDDALREHLTDILYSVKLAEGGEGYIYLLLEAQSSVDDMMAFRLLKYSVQIMQQHLEKNGNKNKKGVKLPLILPIVYYIGKESADGFVPDIHDCFEEPELAKQYFMKPFPIVDLQRMHDDELLKDKVLALLEMFQKNIQNRDLAKIADVLFDEGVYRAVHQQNGNLLQIVLQYIIATCDTKDAMPFIERAIEQLPDERDTIMTMAEELRKEGKQEVILNLLRSGDISEKRAAEITGLSAEELKNSLH